MKPLIGVFPSVKSDGTYWLYENYTNALLTFGALPLVIPTVPKSNSDALFELMDHCDGYLFTGGSDIDPSFYNEKRLAECAESVMARDEFELFALTHAIETSKPILGICRGCQLINVALGGTLCQDIEKSYKDARKHTSESASSPTFHEIHIPLNSPLFKLSVAPRVKINSFHHQCVDKLGRGLKLIATAEDGIPEGVYLEGKRYIIGVQWHPERSYKTESLDKNIFRGFIEAAKNSR